MAEAFFEHEDRGVLVEVNLSDQARIGLAALASLDMASVGDEIRRAASGYIEERVSDPEFPQRVQEARDKIIEILPGRFIQRP